MTGARPYEDQGALFGDLDGLFATVELLPITPVAEIRLVATQGGEFCRPADPDEWDDRACSEYEADGIDAFGLGEHCVVCGWPASEHPATTPPDGTICASCQRAGHLLPTADAPGALF